MGKGRHIAITGNSLYRAGKNGDGITCYDTDNRFISITGNTVTDSQNNGIHTGAPGTIVTGNTVKTLLLLVLLSEA